MNRVAATAAASAAVMLLAACASVQDTSAQAARGEAVLAQMLAGRVAGEPQRCIPLRGDQPLTIVDGAALVAEIGDTIWVNRTAHPRLLDENDRITSRKTTLSELCRMDNITATSLSSEMGIGEKIFLEDFVPYRREG